MKKLVCTLAALAIAMTVLAQNEPVNWQERIQSAKIAFLTNEMSLTPEEAQLFWPVYNKAQKEHQQAVEAAFFAYGALERAVREGKTGKELADLVQKYAEAVDKRDVETKYLNEYLKVLTSEKVAKLYIGEERFRQSQIHSLRQPGMFGQPQSQGQGQASRMPWPQRKKEEK